MLKKHLPFILATSVLTFGMMACDDDDTNNRSCDGRVTARDVPDNNNNGNKGDGNYDPGYEVSVESACDYLVHEGGDLYKIKMDFNYSSASEDSRAAAKKLCIEEINGLPYCKDEFIKECSCLDAQFIDHYQFPNPFFHEVCKTDRSSEACMKALEESTCAAKSQKACVEGLTEAQEKALDDYSLDYYSKYSTL